MPFPCVTAVALHLMDMLDESTSRVRCLRREALLAFSRVRLNEVIIILPHQESPSACLNKKELSQTRANCVRISPTRANCVRFTPNCKIRHLRREALLGCSAFLELLALTFCKVRAIPVSEWYKFRKSTIKLGPGISSMVSNFLLWCEMFFYGEKISHFCLKFGGSI